MTFSKSSPNTPVISVAKRRYELNRKLVAYLCSLFCRYRHDSLTIVIRSLQYTIITANKDPKWTTISKVRPYVSTLKKCRKRTRCPLAEIGRGSVNPSITPRMMNLINKNTELIMD